MSGEEAPLEAYIVHVFGDPGKNRLFITGRLRDTRSFAAAVDAWRPSLHIRKSDLDTAQSLPASADFDPEDCASKDDVPKNGGLASFEDGDELVKLAFTHHKKRGAALQALEAAGISCPDGDIKIPDQYLLEHGLKGPVEITGSYRKGRSVDLVFHNPVIRPLDFSWLPPLRLASIDIETDEKTRSVRAVALNVSLSGRGEKSGFVRLVPPPGFVPALSDKDEGEKIFFHDGEASLLSAFVRDIERLDPDVLTGWNFLDFDFPRLAERCAFHHIPFALGRSGAVSKYFAGEGRRSAAALVPGRQVIDALRIVRASPERYTDYTLDTVAQSVLGEGKTLHSTGKEKLLDLERLWREDPLSFGEYCYKDAGLVLLIFEKTGLFDLTIKRAMLTGVSLDKAWTSVVSFERIYGMELLKRRISPPPRRDAPVSGAAGGTVLEPEGGLFHNVAVFDFRSLYPTIMRTFNIDPLAHARALPASAAASLIVAPNKAAFARTPGILPELIASYFAERKTALEKGDKLAAHVYKILMNSFYGVLGTSACRYGRTELAGAITSYAKKWLHASRDWFNGRGYRVLYGDTDSLFVETNLSDEAPYEDFARLGGRLSGEVNAMLAGKIESEYSLVSFLELRFEKAYRRFMIPPLRALRHAEEGRGRAKGYGAWLLAEDGSLKLEVKGMEAVRRDTTPLGRRLQLELLELVFSGADEERFKDAVLGEIQKLTQGSLDGELVYRKRLSRPPETYTASTPPQVKAARALGWKGRRGTVEYVWTSSGAEPASLRNSPLDYEHYIDSQILSVAESIAAAAGFRVQVFPPKGRQRREAESGQKEFGF